MMNAPLTDSPPTPVQDLAGLLARAPLLHEDGVGRLVSWALSDQALKFIDSTVQGEWATLETGEGVSTLLFELKGARHICITPNSLVIERINEFAAGHSISMDRVHFEVSPSDDLLPSLKLPDLDLVLIDGCHGFPVPYIDWYYTAGALKIGGLLMLDDTQLSSVDVLRRFLLDEPEWESRGLVGPRTALFAKTAAVNPKEWVHQPYVVEMTAALSGDRRSPMRKVLSKGKAVVTRGLGHG